MDAGGRIILPKSILKTIIIESGVARSVSDCFISHSVVVDIFLIILVFCGAADPCSWGGGGCCSLRSHSNEKVHIVLFVTYRLID